MVMGFLSVALYFDSQFLYYITLGVGVASLISNKLANLVVYFWGKLAEIFGWINSRIILSLVFYFILSPIAALSKVFKREDALNRINVKNSLFIEKRHLFKKEDFENVW